MTNSNNKKLSLLGQHIGTASCQLKKMIMFELVKQLNMDTCFRCGKLIESVKELSIDHKEPWMNAKDPVESFYDLNNISFSHLLCNSKAAIQPHKLSGNNDPRATHGAAGWCRGCKCEICKDYKRGENKRNRKRAGRTVIVQDL